MGPNPYPVLNPVIDPVLNPVQASEKPASSLEEYRGDPNFMMSLARGLIVIEALAGRTPHRTIVKLSAETGLSCASVRRCLYTLTQLDVAGFNRGTGYALRPPRFVLPEPRPGLPE